jgi:cysteine-rich repeat protein
VIPAAGGAVTGTFTGTSTLGGSCGGAGPEQVFEWTPALSGTANVKTCNGPTDTVLYVREAHCDIGVPRGCSDDACGYQSDLSFSSVAGTTYFIVVDTYYSNSAGGGFVLDVTPGRCGDGTQDVEEECDDGNAVGGDCCSATCTYESTTTTCTDDGDPCTNDVCDGAGACVHVPPGTCNACTVPTSIPAAGGVFTGTTTGASTLSGCTSSAGAERVYQWTPASSGLATISTCGGTTNYDTVLSVRTAGCASIIACSDDACGLQSSIDLTVSAGQTYLIVVDGYSGNGSYTLTVSPPVVCGDDIMGGAEECDDGNLDPDDGCTELCTVCGNGVIAASEECDDGGLANDDGCSAACRFACPPAPLAGCRLPTLSRKSIIKLKQGTVDAKDVFGWKWGSGPTTPKADFGNPLATDGYLLCIYDGNGHRFTTFAPAAGTCATRPCWSAKPTGFKYGDKELTPRGILKLDLKEGLLPGKAKASVKGKGALLGLPSTSALVTPVRAQLVRPGGPCFEGVFSAPFIKQDDAQFKALSD